MLQEGSISLMAVTPMTRTAIPSSKMESNNPNNIRNMLLRILHRMAQNFTDLKRDGETKRKLHKNNRRPNKLLKIKKKK